VGITHNYIKERLAFYVEWYVLDYDCGGYHVFISTLPTWCGGADAGCEGMSHRWRAPRRRKVRVVVRGQRAIVREVADRWTIEPLLMTRSSESVSADIWSNARRGDVRWVDLHA
jgi:hypothetical protein